jgi:hypothetical protein
MAEERDKYANDPDQGEDVEGHRFSPDDNEKYADSSNNDEEDEVEAHKF